MLGLITSTPLKRKIWREAMRMWVTRMSMPLLLVPIQPLEYDFCVWCWLLGTRDRTPVSDSLGWGRDSARTLSFLPFLKHHLHIPILCITYCCSLITTMIQTVLMYCTLSSDLYFLLLDMLSPVYRKNNEGILLINMGEWGHATSKFSFALARKVQVGACCDGGIWLSVAASDEVMENTTITTTTYCFVGVQ